MRAMVLRFDAPLVSFGSVMVDHHGFTGFFPGVSLLTGMIGNALGWNHSDLKQLESLQGRVDFAARWDVRPHEIVDYHTVDLGSPKMDAPCWTARGETECRAGGSSAKYGTHQRYRHYLVDGLMTVVLSLTGDGYPDLDTVRKAIETPARPLFFGRKTCLPARPLLDPVNPIMEGSDLLGILNKIPLWNREGVPQERSGKVWACWTPRDDDDTPGESRLIYDLRDWRNQLPAGSRWRREGMIGG